MLTGLYLSGLARPKPRFSSFSNTSIVLRSSADSGPRGTTLWALSWNQYRAVRPDQREPGKNYEHTFAPGTCGMGNSLEG